MDILVSLLLFVHPTSTLKLIRKQVSHYTGWSIHGSTCSCIPRNRKKCVIVMVTISWDRFANGCLSQRLSVMDQFRHNHGIVPSSMSLETHGIEAVRIAPSVLSQSSPLGRQGQRWQRSGKFVCRIHSTALSWCWKRTLDYYFSTTV